MKRKHRVRKYLSSILHNNNDLENDVLKNKKENEKKAEKILNLLDSGENTIDKPQLKLLVEEFYQGYQSLHGHFDDFVGRLKKSAHRRGGSDNNIERGSSSSESSDSVAGDASVSRDKETKIQEVNEEMHLPLEEYRYLKEQIDYLKMRNNELETSSVSLVAKVEENEVLAAKLEEKEAAIITLENRFQTTRMNMEALQTENNVFKKDIGASMVEINALNQRIESGSEQNEALLLENFRISSRLLEADKSIEENKIEIQEMMYEVSQLKLQNSLLKEDREKTDEEIAKLTEQVTVLKEEKEELGSEKLMLLKERGEMEKVISNSKMEIDNLLSRNERLGCDLESFAEREAVLLQTISTAEQGERDLMFSLDAVKNENSKLQEINHNLSEEVLAKDDKISSLAYEQLTLVEKLQKAQEENKALAGKLGEKEAAIEALENRIQTLSVDIEALQTENEALKKGFEASEVEIDDLNKRIRSGSEQKEALLSENSRISSKLLEADKSIEENKIEIQETKYEVSQLKLQNSLLKQEQEKTEEEITNLKEKMANLKKDKEDLGSEKLMLLNERGDMKNVISNLELEIDGLLSGNKRLKGDFESSAGRETDLLQKMAVAEKRNEEMMLSLDVLKNENSKLQDINRNQSQEVLAKDNEISSLVYEKSTIVESFQKAQDESRELSMEVDRLNNKILQLSETGDKLKLEFQSAIEDAFGMRDELKAKEDEKQLLTAEKVELLARMEKLVDVINDLESKIQKLEGDNCHLQTKINDLSIEFDNVNSQLFHLREVSMTQEAENNQLATELSTLTSLLQEKENDMKELEENLAHMREQNSILRENEGRLQQAEKSVVDFNADIELLRAEKSQLNERISSLVLDLEAANDQLIGLKELQGASEEEKKTLTSELSSARSKIQLMEAYVKDLEIEQGNLREESSMLKQHVNDLNNQNAELHQSLDAARNKSLSVLEELEETKNRTSNEIHDMFVHANNLSEEIEMLRNKEVKLEKEIESITQTSSEKEISMIAMEEKLTTKICDLENTVESQRNRFGELLENYNKLKLQFDDSCTNLDTAEKKIKEMEEGTIHTLEMVDREQKEEISKLEENHQELVKKLKVFEVEKGDVDREIVKLNRQVQTLEVKLRLSNQKLKITETETKEKEESFEKTLEDLRGHQSKLDGQVKALHKNVISLENELRNMKEAAENGVVALHDKFQELELVFVKDCGYVQNRLVGCTEELNVVKMQLVEHIYKKRELMNEKHDLIVRLKYKDGIVSMLNDKVKGEEKLLTRVSEAEQKLEELQKVIREKDNELMCKDEEKREAIRQLCLQIEFHRENCNILYRYLSKVKRNSR